MRRRMMTPLLALAIAIGCGGESTSSPPPPPATLTGSWGGVAVTQPTTLTLLENNGVVSGTGTIANTPTGTRALTVTGIFTNGTNFSLTLSSGTIQPINFSGTLNRTVTAPQQLIGTFTGSGFNGEAVILSKQ